MAGLRAQGRIIYICTNGVFMRKKMREHLAATYGPAVEPTVARLLSEGLITEKEAEQIRNPDEAARKKVTMGPTKWMYWNVHVDGLEYTHDLIVEREGVFRSACWPSGWQDRRLPGGHEHHGVQGDQSGGTRADVPVLSSLEVDGHTISPGYDYDAAKKGHGGSGWAGTRRISSRTRDLVREKFRTSADGVSSSRCLERRCIWVSWRVAANCPVPPGRSPRTTSAAGRLRVMS